MAVLVTIFRSVLAGCGRCCAAASSHFLRRSQASRTRAPSAHLELPALPCRQSPHERTAARDCCSSWRAFAWSAGGARSVRSTRAATERACSAHQRDRVRAWSALAFALALSPSASAPYCCCSAHPGAPACSRAARTPHCCPQPHHRRHSQRLLGGIAPCPLRSGAPSLPPLHCYHCSLSRQPSPARCWKALALLTACSVQPPPCLQRSL